MGLKDFLFNNDYSFLLQIAIILLSTKLLGLLTKRISLPQVVGALAAGIVLGPMVLNWALSSSCSAPVWRPTSRN